MSDRSTTDGSMSKSLFKNHNFMFLWSGQIVSQTGDAVSNIGALFAIMDMTNNSALAMSGIVACEYIPALLVGLWAGVFVDRWDKKRTMIVSDVLRLGLSATMILWILLRWMPGIYISALLLGVVSQFFNPAKSAIIPSIVEKDSLLAANSISSTAFMLVMTAGTALGGGLYAWLGGKACFAINSVSFAVSAATIAAMRVSAMQKSSAPANAAGPATLKTLFGEFNDGFRYILDRRELRTLFAGFLIAMLGFGVVNVLGAKFITDELHLSKELYSLCAVFSGVGAALASGLIAGLSGRFSPSQVFSAGLILLSLPLMVLALFVKGFAPLSAAMVFVGIGNVMVNIGSNTILQSRVAEEFRGRVFGLMYPLITLATLISAGLGGVFTNFVGLRMVFVAAGFLGLMSGLAMGLFLPRRLGEPAEREAA